ncbi:MAG: enoyl-CoA hydratase-related protein [Methylorubrum populi]
MSATYETIRVETVREGVRRLVLARPAKHNALNAAMIADLVHASEALRADETVRVVVLSAEGRSFCAGGDLDWMRSQAERSRPERQAEAEALAGMLDTLDRLPKLLIGEVRGPAYGGGVGLVALCDIAFAVPDARFALTEARLGLIPATISPFVVRRIGGPNARRIMLNARPVDGAEACRMGLVSAVVAPEAMEKAVEAEIAFALQCAPGAVAESKALIRRLADGEPLGPGATASLLADRWESEEARAGIAAFFARIAR